MYEWMLQWKAKAPDVPNVSGTDVLGDEGGMFAGAPETALKTTVCWTVPKVNVTTVPLVTVSVVGLNTSPSVASIVFAGTDPVVPMVPVVPVGLE